MILLDEYLAKKPVAKRRTYDRLYSLGHCDALVRQLSAPMSLDEALRLIRANPTVDATTTSAASAGNSAGNSKAGTAATAAGGHSTAKATAATNSATATASASATTSATSASTSTNFNKSWLHDLPHDGLHDAVELHLKTMAALKDREKWSLVALPNNITGPPVDIIKVGQERQKSSSLKKRYLPPLAAAWADGEGAEESLYWVAYASQVRGDRIVREGGV
jgi:hypothetical protein